VSLFATGSACCWRVRPMFGRFVAPFCAAEARTMLFGTLFLGACCGGAVIVGVLGALVAALLLRGKDRALIVVLIVLFGPGLCMLPAACVLAGYSAITGREVSFGGSATVVATEAVPPVMPVKTIVPTEAPAEVALSPDEILGRSVETMNGVTSAHIVFEQEVVGSYTASGEGVLVLPDRAHFEKTSTYDEEPVETIVIGATGYWVDESVSGGWNSGPIAPFASNPARWVELLRFYQNPTLLGMETVHGVDCYRLQFDVTFEPGWLGLFSGEGTGEAWVAEGDFSLAKAVYAVTYEGARESDSMKLTLELSDFNAPVSIEAPR
jgi:hypothetical protein